MPWCFFLGIVLLPLLLPLQLKLFFSFFRNCNCENSLTYVREFFVKKVPTDILLFLYEPRFIYGRTFLGLVWILLTNIYFIITKWSLARGIEFNASTAQPKYIAPKTSFTAPKQELRLRLNLRSKHNNRIYHNFDIRNSNTCGLNKRHSFKVSGRDTCIFIHILYLIEPFQRNQILVWLVWLEFYLSCQDPHAKVAH